ncbi:hypothetical protein L207DRAFT_142509 [Hyaloscypha variabilis F]|uniref:Uncharacterized protein n=1 Tax=Hyaloscypha variabilis (strain UAMH 11265 / GT02V1 / F) TaxID=1149755 RepID=A0A2J6R539_HYAVF|nr:hypothetical protein L207DRAFT_142509 [Hyaloscypha variabilis F]
MAFSEIIRFVLLHHRKSEFLKLREYLKLHGVKEQYFGNMIAPPTAALPVRKDEMCWVIHWPHDSEMRTNSAFRTQLNGLTEGQGAKFLLFKFQDNQFSDLTKALEANICEFAIINLTPNAPKSNADFKYSMHKTYTDCYRMQGFVGGEWAYALNTNDTNGVLVNEVRNKWLEEKERSLACYYLGWESIEAHQAASKTAIFDEEMVKLAPWFGMGSGAWYVKFERHV